MSARAASATALANSETNLRTLIEASSDMVLVHRDGRLAFINEVGARALGYAPAELVGRDVIELVAPSDREEARQRLAQSLPLGSVLRVQERKLLARDGSIRVTEVTNLRLLFDGAPSMVSIARDVTSQRHILANMMEMDRMMAVGTLAAGVAHEINNPLAYLLANLDFVESELAMIVGKPAGEVAAELAEIRAALADARDGGRRVRDIVRDLKTFSRQDDDLRHALPLEKVLESAVAMAWNEIRHRATLVREFSPVPPVVANEARLGQVFLNLLLNAAQSIPEGRATSHRVVVRTMSEAGAAIVEVEDDGAGIPADVMPRIFDPFFTTKPVGEGTGLGLSICRGIVSSLGGTLDLRSEVGRGTTARITLPVAGAEAIASPLPRVAAAPPRGRVLVVDDEPLVVVAIRRALGPDLEVLHAGGGREALTLLERGGPFDAIVCDLMMPDVDGIDVFEQTKARAPDLASRIIFLTGGAFTPRARSFVARDGVTVVEKPFEGEALRTLVRARIALGAPL